MIEPGLVSITFRQCSPAEIIDLVRQAGLTGIEWGGDVHIPPGQLEVARAVGRRTVEAGLKVAAYGSYYRLSHDEETGPFEMILETAAALGAPVIRVWAGRQGSDKADEAHWQTIISESHRIADLAAAEEITIVYEFHTNTLTDSNESARRLLERVAHDTVKSYWQPPRYSALDYNLAGLDLIEPWLHNVHVFNWHQTSGDRLPLAEATGAWRQYLTKVSATGRHHYALLEFVQADEPQNFLRDAAALLHILSLVG